MKTVRGKLVMAGIILSCGLVMNADPNDKRPRAKRVSVAEARTWQGLRAAESLARPGKTVKAIDAHEQRSSW